MNSKPCLRWLVLLLLMAAPTSAEACSRPPTTDSPTTPEEWISRSRVAYVGRIVGPRRWGQAVGIRVVEPIRGVARNQLLEAWVAPTSCGQLKLDHGKLYLFGASDAPERIEDVPSAEQLEAWRQLPQK